MKRMFAFQLQLSLKRGLPLSRLLNQHFNTKAKQELLKVQEESASPPLKAKQDKIKQVKEIVEDNMKEEKGEESGPGNGKTGLNHNRISMNSTST